MSSSINLNDIARLQEVFNMLPGNVYWKDAQGRYIGCNNNLTRIFNSLRIGDVIGRKDREIFNVELAKETEEIDQRVMQGKQSLVLEEHGLNIDGEFAIYLTNKVPIIDNLGTVRGLLGISFDITERKRAEEVIVQAKEQAEAASMLKSEFIRNMEHDIRTPFHGIWGLADYLSEHEQDSEKRSILMDIATCARQLLDYCNAILDFSRIESNQIAIMDKKFDLFELLESIIQMERPPARLKNLELTLEMDPKLPKFVIGDSYRIQRILINLVSNAIKFTHHGSVSIIAKVAKVIDMRHLNLRIVVADTGIGIPKEKQDIVYERFTRLTSAQRGQYQGLGLGLTVVKQFMHDLDGDIDIESSSGQGTKFNCIIPFKLPLIDEIMT